MKKSLNIILIVTLLFFLAIGFASSQEQKVLIKFFYDASGDLKIVNETGDEEIYGYDLDYDEVLPIGWTIVTGNGDFAELQLEPNGTIIKIAENTNFKVNSLQGLEKAPISDFSLGFGKFRTIIGKLTGDEQYNFRGRNATCGVRGTDFGMQIIEKTNPGIVEETFVFKGKVEYTLNDTGKSIEILAGQFANALSENFAPVEMPPDMKNDLLNKLNFEKLDPDSVPSVGDTTSLKDATPSDEKEDSKPKKEKGPFFDFLAKILGFEIGSMIIDDTIYAKAVITPTFSIGKLEMSLYLPIIYTNNIFDPDDWYQPKGNNEWSFGTDQDGDISDIFKDIAQDLFLKIKYVKWAEQRDPFYLKIGNLNDITIGHGLIMRNYANDCDFPSIRRIGFNMGIDSAKLGFETMINDFTEPEIMGGRFYIRPAAPGFPLAIGLTGIIDIDPAGDLDLYPSTSLNYEDVIGDPVLINIAFDLEFPIIEKDTFSLILFADIGCMLPYYTNDGDASLFPNIEKGLAADTLYTKDPFRLKNFGAAGGVFGNTGPVDFRGELRYSTGIFTPYMFNNLYDRQRGEYAANIAEYTNNPDADEFDKRYLGIYGEAGYTLKDVFHVEAGYYLPFSISDDGFKPEKKDYLHLEAGLDQGVIPIVNIGISLAYDRYYFIPLIIKGEAEENGETVDLHFFDAFSVFKTKVIYGVSDNLDLVLLLTTTIARDENGDPKYNDESVPEIVTTFTIETQIHF